MAHSARSKYEVVIGIEVHVQLTTQSKIFCSCKNQPGAQPNTTICPVCAGHPGVLPVFNQEVARCGVMAGLATHCTIHTTSVFDRKHYFYPDLPKGYQITQNEHPICTDGYLEITTEDGSPKKIRVMRIHIEEDAGKNIHAAFSNESFVDLNRAGTPLLEIVTLPDISSAHEASEYLQTLRNTVIALGIGTGNMEEGSFRADTNISLRLTGATKLGTKVELKNINSFKFIRDAIESEIDRQITALESGETILQETRLWDNKERKTTVMRTKEGAADYRYFHEPDLRPLVLDQAFIEQIKNNLPELPWDKRSRYQKELGLSAYEADVLVKNPEYADYFEKARTFTTSDQLSNWVLRDLMGYVKEHKIDLPACKITPELLAELVELIATGVINNRAAQEIFAVIGETGQHPRTIVEERGLAQVQDSAELATAVHDIIAANPSQVAAYKAGQLKLFGFFVGQVMAKTRGRANPQLVNELLKKALE